jgi:catechol 2,3-dioxygenase-like lactoylglutathione lyase family enzyme
MKRTWTIIGVSDVARSLAWYQALFGQPQTAPAHDDFGMILDADGTVLLCLHQWGSHEHPTLMSPDHATPGNGLLLFFRVDDFDQALPRARALVTGLEEDPHVNPNTRTSEFSLRDPDGYWVTISALDSSGSIRQEGESASELRPRDHTVQQRGGFIESEEGNETIRQQSSAHVHRQASEEVHRQGSEAVSRRDRQRILQPRRADQPGVGRLHGRGTGRDEGARP